MDITHEKIPPIIAKQLEEWANENATLTPAMQRMLNRASHVPQRKTGLSMAMFTSYGWPQIAAYATLLLMLGMASGWMLPDMDYAHANQVASGAEIAWLDDWPFGNMMEEL